MNLFKRKMLKEEMLMSAAGTPAATTLRLVIMIVIVSIAVYFNALFNAFVFDDIFQIVENPWIRDISNVPTIFSSSVWAFETKASVLHYYRPMMHLIFMVNYHVFGLHPWGFHLVNILLHAGVSILVFIIARRFLKDSYSSRADTYLSPPFIAAMLFATHPIHTEAVTWIAAVPELACTFFFLLSFYLYVRSEDGSKSIYVRSLLSFVFALISKETALILPIILAVYDYAFKNGGQSFFERLRRFVPYFIIIGLYMIVRSYGLRDVAPVEKVVRLSTWQYAVNIISFFVQYVEKLILPLNLNAYHMFHPIKSALKPEGLLSAGITVVFIIIVALALKKNKPVFFGLVLVTVPLIPTFYIVGNSEVGISERYLYLPSFGFVLLLALFVNKIRTYRPKMTISLGIVLSMLIGLYSYGTISRNTIWKDEYSFWTDTAKKSPDSAILREALCTELYNRGNTDEAIEECLLALEINPSYAAAHIDLGAAYNKKGLMDRSVDHFIMALQLKPSSWEAHYGLGLTFLKMGRLDEAIEHLNTSLRLNPAQDANAYYGLGQAYKAKGLIDEAIVQYEMVVKLAPTAAAHNNLGTLYDSKNMFDKAIEQYEAALKKQPDFVKAYHNLGIAYAKMGLFDRAVENLEHAVRLNPDDQGLRRSLEKVYEMKKQPHNQTHLID